MSKFQPPGAETARYLQTFTESARGQAAGRPR